MPPIARTTCRVEGCSKPRHEYPKSGRSVYCTDHLYLKKKSRKGHEIMTGPERDVLHLLLEAKRAGEPFIPLRYPQAHGTTLKRLFDKDWVFASAGLYGTRYKITLRGEEMLAYYETTLARRDKMCPRCGVNPKIVLQDGRLYAYCKDCERKRNIKKRLEGKAEGDTDRPCSRCQKRHRHQYPNGRWSTYCKHCESINRRKNARKQRRAELKQVKNGGPVPLCKRCKQNPRKVHPNSIATYCEACLPIMRKQTQFRHVIRAHRLGRV